MILGACFAVRQYADALTEPSDHLALDEALLLAGRDALRLWQFTVPVVVAGRSTRVDQEIERRRCLQQRVPILRRCSGGAAVVGGPGCLMYSVVLDLAAAATLRRIDAAHDHVMLRVLGALQRQLPAARRQGICDLTWQNLKCSGNSLRVTRDAVLYHGTILYDFDLGMISRLLKMPPRQPEYRQGRQHQSFVTNVPIDPEGFADDLRDQFGVRETVSAADFAPEIEQLKRDRYANPRWHFRH